jgi:hypothetical protein
MESPTLPVSGPLPFNDPSPLQQRMKEKLDQYIPDLPDPVKAMISAILPGAKEGFAQLIQVRDMLTKGDPQKAHEFMGMVYQWIGEGLYADNEGGIKLTYRASHVSSPGRAVTRFGQDWIREEHPDGSITEKILDPLPESACLDHRQQAEIQGAVAAEWVGREVALQELESGSVSAEQLPAAQRLAGEEEHG